MGHAGRGEEEGKAEEEEEKAEGRGRGGGGRPAGGSRGSDHILVRCGAVRCGVPQGGKKCGGDSRIPGSRDRRHHGHEGGQEAKNSGQTRRVSLEDPYTTVATLASSSTSNTYELVVPSRMYYAYSS